MTDELVSRGGEVVFYEAPDGWVRLDVRLERETLSVGDRVNSKRGTQFRIWATRTLRDHLLRGFTLNERRLRENARLTKLVA